MAVDLMMALLAPKPDEGWTAGNWTTLIGSIVTVIGAIATGVITYRASVRSNREKIAADTAAAKETREAAERDAREKRELDERNAERAEVEAGQRRNDEQVERLRHHYDALIDRLTAEIASLRAEVAQVREQLSREQDVSDTLRGKVRHLEDRIHELQLALAEYRDQRIEDDTKDARHIGPAPGGA